MFSKNNPLSRLLNILTSIPLFLESFQGSMVPGNRSQNSLSSLKLFNLEAHFSLEIRRTESNRRYFRIYVGTQIIIIKMNFIALYTANVSRSPKIANYKFLRDTF